MKNLIIFDKNKNYNLHIDGSFQPLYNLAFGGGCILDGDKMIESFASLLPSNIPNNFHEYFALSYSLEQSLSLGISNISVQTDCLRLDEDIKTLLDLKKNENEEIEDVFKKLDLLNKIKRFNSFTLDYKPREENLLADYIVNKFCTKYIEENNLKRDIVFKKVYTNSNKIFKSQDITVSNDFIKKISNQIVGVLTFNHSGSVNLKLLHYSKNDLNCLKKEHNVVIPSKGFGKKVVIELGKFLNEIEEKNIRISFTGDLHEKLMNYVRPNSELLDEVSKNNINNVYEKFEVINFTPLTDFAIQVKKFYIEESNKFNGKDMNTVSESKKAIHKYKNFFFLAMKTLGHESEQITRFLSENNDNPFIQEVSNLNLELKQKFFFEKFLSVNDLNNISSYLKHKENFKNNGVNFKF